MSFQAGSPLEKAYQVLQEQLNAVQLRLSRSAPNDRAETAGGFPQSTLANAPLAASLRVRAGDVLFITNGRKSGETAGNGTGIPAYYNAVTDSWLRFSDDGAVTV